MQQLSASYGNYQESVQSLEGMQFFASSTSPVVLPKLSMTCYKNVLHVIFCLISFTLFFYKFILLQLQMSAVRTCLNLPLFNTNQRNSPIPEYTRGLFYLITVYRLQNAKQNR
jgi:hypothetical protein